jgi:hypothetical protein
VNDLPSCFEVTKPITDIWWENINEINQLGRPRHRWDNNIKMDRKEIDRGVVELL